MLTPQQARETCAALEPLTFEWVSALGFEVNQPAGVIGDPWYAWTPRSQLIGEYETQDAAQRACVDLATRFQNLGRV